MSLLGRITGPSDLKGLSTATLPALAQEIRAFLIDKVSRVGGHLGPNLGMVELTIAVHRVLDSPRDVLLFDTGHQAYVHKILTGRCAEFDSLRQAGGMCWEALNNIGGAPNRPVIIVLNDNGRSYAPKRLVTRRRQGETITTVPLADATARLCS